MSALLGIALAGSAALLAIRRRAGRRRAAQRLAAADAVPARAPDGAHVIFLGAGSSVGMPRPGCLFGADRRCAVCPRALEGPPEDNPDYRCNPSLLVRLADGRNVLIDCGKHFRESMLRWFPRYGVRHVDAVVLTHHHADAVLGLDDLRTLQRFDSVALKPIGPPTPVFADQPTFDVLCRVFPYLTAPPPPGAEKRFVSSIEWPRIAPLEPFEAVEGFRMLPVPLQHGSDCVALGFVFGREDRVAYLSDVNEVPDETMAALEAEGTLALLVVDALKRGKHNTHFGIKDAIKLARRLRPRRTLCVGMTCQLPYEETNVYLREKAPEVDIQLARDGQVVSLSL